MFKNVQITTAKTQFHTFPTKHKHDVSENLASLAYLKLYIYRLHMESLYFTYFSTFFSPAPCRLHHLGLLDLPSEGSGTGCRLSGGATGFTMGFPWEIHGKTHMEKNQKMVATVKLSPVGS
jgi:hypothetical protein